jgi:hypothetical protein
MNSTQKSEFVKTGKKLFFLRLILPWKKALYQLLHIQMGTRSFPGIKQLGHGYTTTHGRLKSQLV